jgi:hypothetical protein
MNNNINSLYNLIKEQSKLKGRPLKIVVDWDDCLQAHRSWYVFQASPDKDNWDKFPEYFEAYFNEDTAKNKEVVEFVKKVKKDKTILANYRKQFGETVGMKERFKAPLTTIAEDLLKALKEEDLIEALLVITSFSYEGEKGKTAFLTCSSNNGKFEKFLKTFGKIPDICNFDHTELKKNEEGKWAPTRWERIETLLPDFDLFIDDSKANVLEMAKHFPDKVYALNDYQNNKEVAGPNFFLVKTDISNLKNESFIFKRAPKKQEGGGIGENSQSPHDDEEISLKSLIKDQVRKQGRKVKIICDWDECILPVKPWAVYHFSNKKMSFQELFEEFWENSTLEPGSTGGNKKCDYFGSNEIIKEAIVKFKELGEQIKKDPTYQNFFSSPLRYQAPFLSMAKEVLECLEEDLISELVVISSFGKGKASWEDHPKKGIFKKTFGQFPNTKISIYEVTRDESSGKNSPHRYEWIRDNHPDFDMFIDDNNSVIASCKKHFSADKSYVIPDYDYSRVTTGDNVHHVKNNISNVKIEDFTKAVEKWKTKKAKEAKQTKEKEQKKKRERERVLLNDWRWDSDVNFVGSIFSYY